jgi:hypothetical protein
MGLTIVLTAAEADCLRTSIPIIFAAHKAIDRAISLRQQAGSTSSTVVIRCDEAQAHEMLAYARSVCHSAIRKIQTGFGELAANVPHPD